MIWTSKGICIANEIQVNKTLNRTEDKVVSVVHGLFDLIYSEQVFDLQFCFKEVNIGICFTVSSSTEQMFVLLQSTSGVVISLFISAQLSALIVMQ